MRYKRDFLTIFTLRSYWTLWSRHKCNIIDDTRTLVVRHSREYLTTIVRHSCVHLTTVVRHSCDCPTTVRASHDSRETFVRHSRDCLTTFVRYHFLAIKTAITLASPTVGRPSADLSADLSADKMPDFSSFFIGRQK